MALFTDFLEQHPDWQGDNGYSDSKRVITIRFWLKPESRPRRAQYLNPLRTRFINEQEASLISTFVATLIKGKNLKARLMRMEPDGLSSSTGGYGPEYGILEYEIKVLDYEPFLNS